MILSGDVLSIWEKHRTYNVDHNDEGSIDNHDDERPVDDGDIDSYDGNILSDDEYKS